MKRVANLFEKVTTLENLLVATERASRGKRLKMAVARFLFRQEQEVYALREELMSGIYHPRDYFVFEIKEPKARTICASDFRDRVVHHAVCKIIDPYLERRLISDTYACRTGKGTHAALGRATRFVQKYRYFLKCDVQKYFQSIDHGSLKVLLARLFKDAPLLGLLGVIIDHSVPGNAPGTGLPIGNLTSQHFANLYLGELDHELKDRLRIPGYVRYMDDFICFSDCKEELWSALAHIREFLSTRLKLSLKEKVVQIAPVSEGLPFLGYRIFPNLIRLQRPNVIRLRQAIRRLENAYRMGWVDEKTLYQSMNSRIAHLQHAQVTRLLRKEFEDSLNLA